MCYSPLKKFSAADDRPGDDAEAELLAVAAVLRHCPLLRRLRLDRDTRSVRRWSTLVRALAAPPRLWVGCCPEGEGRGSAATPRHIRHVACMQANCREPEYEMDRTAACLLGPAPRSTAPARSGRRATGARRTAILACAPGRSRTGPRAARGVAMLPSDQID